MKHLLRLAVVADLVALSTVMLGSWTRINGAGLTCPDWPLCRGRLLPSFDGGTIWEWSHRLLASAVAPLVIALIVVAWRQRHRSPFVAPTTGAIAALFFVQVVLGAETVRLANTPFSVVLHWATAMALIASLTAMAIFAAAAETAHSGSRKPWHVRILAIALSVTAFAAFATMCVGAYVSSSGAGLACLTIPGCAGNVIVYTPGQTVQMLHRAAAGATLLAAAASLALVWTLAAASRIRAIASLGAALVAMQVLLGLLNVTLRLPPTLREAHAVNAALVFLSFFVAAVLAVLEAAQPGMAPIAEKVGA